MASGGYPSGRGSTLKGLEILVIGLYLGYHPFLIGSYFSLRFSEQAFHHLVWRYEDPMSSAQLFNPIPFLTPVVM
jgi:hypothetical protein